jgi:hypothetical protein
MAIAFALMLLSAPHVTRASDDHAPLAALGSQPMATGYRYTLSIAQRAVDSRGRVREEPHFAGTARTLGPLVRVDLDSLTARLQRATWYVTRDAGGNVTFVDEARRMVAELPVSTLGDRVQEERRMRVRLSDVRMRWRAARPCGPLGEWATRCVTLDVQYRAHARLSLVSDVTDVSETIEYRLIPAITDLVLPLESFFSTRLDLLAHRDPAFAQQWRQAQRMRPAGSIVRLTVDRTESQGRTHNTIRRVIALDSLERATHQESLFEVPAGFRLAPR